MSSEQSQLPRSSAADYEFLEKLGRGNSGTVFKVRRRSDKKFYVVKQVRHPQFCHPSSSSPRFTSVITIVRQVDIGCVSAEEQTEALNECSILASMNHPNVIQCARTPALTFYNRFLVHHAVVCRYLDSFVDDDMLHIVMEWAEAGNRLLDVGKVTSDLCCNGRASVLTGMQVL